MRRRLVPALLALCALAVLAAPAVAAPRPAPAGAAARAQSDLPLPQIEAVVELRHPRGLNRFVRAVSDPASRHYRQYATVRQLVERFGATEKQQKQTLAWFERRGVSADVAASGSFLLARLDPAQAARLLPPASGASASGGGGGGERRVPVALRGLVRRIDLVPRVPVSSDIVFPTARERSAAARASKKEEEEKKQPKKPYTSLKEHSGTAAGCREGRKAIPSPFEAFTPSQFLKAYGHSSLHARGIEGQGESVAVVETGGFRRSDIATFAKCFGVRTPKLEVDPVYPRHKPGAPEDETTLDLETLAVGAPKLNRIRVYEGVGSPAGVALTAAAALGRPGRQPNVVSISLGFCEPLLAGQLAIKRAFDNTFAIAAGAGISVLISAGDQGSSGCRAGPPGEEKTELPVLAVAQPSSSPYATAVGGTNFVLSAQNRLREEITWNDQPLASAATGGGPSLLTPRRPWWQRGVHRYGEGRIVPDISALADIVPGYAYYCTAAPCQEEEQTFPGWGSVGGTSAAAPLTAAGIALVDQYLAGRGQPPLGFLNPLLYELGGEQASRAGVFFDVRRGNNDLGRMLLPEVGGGFPLGCCAARSGYDWATGWGSLKLVGFARAAARAGLATAVPVG
jgi:kumamolisin